MSIKKSKNNQFKQPKSNTKEFIYSDSGKIIVSKDLFISLVYKAKRGDQYLVEVQFLVGIFKETIFISYESEVEAEQDVKSFLENLKNSN